MTFQGRNIKKHFKQSSPSVAEKAQNLEEDDEESGPVVLPLPVPNNGK